MNMDMSMDMDMRCMVRHAASAWQGKWCMLSAWYIHCVHMVFASSTHMDMDMDMGMGMGMGMGMDMGVGMDMDMGRVRT